MQETMILLDEMISRGNLVAGYQKSELQQLDATLNQLPGSPWNVAQPNPASLNAAADWHIPQSANDTASSQMNFDYMADWSSDGGMSGGQLLNLADALDFENLLWSDPRADMEQF